MVTGLLIVLIAIPLLTPVALCWIFFLGKGYGAVVFAAQLILMAAATWLSRKRHITEAERMRQIDKAMSEPSDDPRQMARWVP